MNLDLYNEILSIIHNHKGFTKDLSEIVEEKYPSLSEGTVKSIISSEWQRITRRCNHKNSEVADRIYNLYMEARDREKDTWSLDAKKWKTNRKKILQIATEYRIPPTLVARVVLTKFYETDDDIEVKKPTKKCIKEMLTDTTLIDDLDLSLEVYWATLYDDQYSPLTELIKQQIGYEYECKLKHCCIKETIAFKDEEKLRKEGFDKTPDIKLELPILINGVAITWIESKALFADEETHKIYIKDQYSSYWNRWGPGLVIYWFGYTENIINSSEKRFIVMDDFPSSESITHLNYARPDQQIIDNMKYRLSHEAYLGKRKKCRNSDENNWNGACQSTSQQQDEVIKELHTVHCSSQLNGVENLNSSIKDVRKKDE